MVRGGLEMRLGVNGRLFTQIALSRLGPVAGAAAAHPWAWLAKANYCIVGLSDGNAS